MNGWTCLHVGNVSGPCWKCAPASGLCERCSYPLDDHELIGRDAPTCKHRRKAAA